MTGKYSQKLLDHAKQFATDAFKASSKIVIQKTSEATDDLIGNKIVDKITKISKTSQQNNSETVTNEYDKEIPKERYIYIYIYMHIYMYIYMYSIYMYIYINHKVISSLQFDQI